MGLAAAKNKRKLGNDPNNTKWSRNTDSFGQKILRAQGWEPGQYLGAKDASHAEWHTEANLAHIKVVLKDDNLGLGAKRNHGDECTGLDAFQHLLGRLNGKSDEALETERKAREDLKLSLYVERKLGTIRFVKGGWLVGDQVKETPDVEVADLLGNAASATPADSAEPATEASRKRKADQDPDRDDDKAQKREKKSKKRKTKTDSADVREKKDKKKSEKRGAGSHGGDEKVASSSTSSKQKKDEKKVNEGSAQCTSAAGSEAGDIPDDVGNSDEVEKVRKQKKHKKKGKGEKKEKKDKSKKNKTASSLETETGESLSKDKKQRKDGSCSETMISEESASLAPTPAESGISTPSGSGYSTPTLTGSSRYLARSRFIAQKRMAFTDTAALNQIFMIKS
ncbi:hypothetical protein C8A03DRAFT_41712 [Achaetomium macrosporum]|uniref:PinX1-related protein 1 n=1 Tax=Achaetomium macrosporum TaxID=79813 RepID=A0AAN7HEE0_9PEZI|nr:hypothetical protein C8A03DRAFT_41712 [Achaetomium macrosporum]